MTQELKIDTKLYEFIIALNCSINDTYTAAVIDTLKPEYITDTDVQSYLNIIFTFYNKHQKLPNSTEIKTYLDTEELKTSFRNVVTKFKTLDTEYDLDELIINTEQYIKERAVYYAVKDTVNQISNTNSITNTGEILERFQTACNISLIDNIGFDYFNQIDQHIDDISVVDRFMPTGYRWLDKMFGGGWLEGGRALYMFMGRTNVGKSIVLGNIATKQVERGRTVVLITLEMPEMIYGKRVSAQLSRIPFAALKEEKENLRKYLYTFKQKNPGSRLIIKEFPPSSISANHIKAYLKKLKTKNKIKPDLVVLDYLTLMIATTPIGSLYSDNKAVAEQVRALTYPQNFGCPFISAGQLNRGGMTEEDPGMESTSDSIGIPMTVDASVSLWQKEGDKELGILNMGMQKSRFGVAFGSQAFKIDYDTLAIDEMEDVFSNTDSIQDTDQLLQRLSNERS